MQCVGEECRMASKDDVFDAPAVGSFWVKTGVRDEKIWSLEGELHALEQFPVAFREVFHESVERVLTQRNR